MAKFAAAGNPAPTTARNFPISRIPIASSQMTAQLGRTGDLLIKLPTFNLSASTSPLVMHRLAEPNISGLYPAQTVITNSIKECIDTQILSNSCPLECGTTAKTIGGFDQTSTLFQKSFPVE
jgi:hypothetical protein